jgi:hypothetical protein
MSKDHIEKGMFLRGGSYPARIVPRQEDPTPLDEIRIRLQRVKEALEFIRGAETRDEWLKRMEGW